MVLYTSFFLFLLDIFGGNFMGNRVLKGDSQTDNSDMGCVHSKENKEKRPKAVGESSVRHEDLAQRLAKIGPEQLVVMRLHGEDCQKCCEGGVCATYESMVEKFPQVVFLDADPGHEKNWHVVEGLKIESTPTFVAFKANREIGRHEENDPQALEALVKEMME